jgi:hypothetical protein
MLSSLCFSVIFLPDGAMLSIVAMIARIVFFTLGAGLLLLMLALWFGLFAREKK